MPQQIITYIYNYQLDYVQFDGDVSPMLIDNLRRSIIPDIRPNLHFIKTIYVADEVDVINSQQYEGYADMLLFDAKSNQGGSIDEPFNWNILHAYHGKLPFLLSGGIGPNDVTALHQFYHPQCFGININRKFETIPFQKDIQLLQKFISEFQKREV